MIRRDANDIDAHIENGSPDIEDTSNQNPSIKNHFKYGTQILYKLITILFNCILTHGLAPDDLLICTMVPLINKIAGKISNVQITANHSQSVLNKPRYLI